MRYPWTIVINSRLLSRSFVASVTKVEYSIITIMTMCGIIRVSG